MENNINTTLNERANSHGDFKTQAALTQDLKTILRKTKNWETLPAFTKQSLEMICDKISRALEGNPKHQDHWHDIQGYAALAEQNYKRDE